MRIKTKLSFLLPSLILLPMLVSMALQLPHLKQQIHDTELERFDALLMQVSARLSRNFSSLQHEVMLYARTQTIRSLEPEPIRAYLQQEIDRKQAFFSDIMVADTKGYFFSTLPGNPAQAHRHTFDNTDPKARPHTTIRRDYWRYTVADNPGEVRSIVSNPMMAYTNQQRQIIVAASINDDTNNVIGMVGGVIKWEQVIAQLNTIEQTLFDKVNWLPRFFIVSKGGSYWFHWDENKIVDIKTTQQGQQILSQDLQAISESHSILDEPLKEWQLAASAILDQQQGHFRYTDPTTQGRAIVSFTPIDNTGFTLGMVTDESLLLEDTPDIVADNIAIFGLAAMATLMVALILARNTTRPLHSLNQYAHQIEEGSSTIPRDLQTHDEFGELALQLQHLSATVETRQRELRDCEERFTLAMKGSSDGVWDWNLVTDEVYFSPRWYEMLGYKKEEIAFNVETFFQLLHPDDVIKTQTAVNQCLTNKESFYHVDLRMLHKDGHLVYIMSRAYLVCDPSTGEPSRLVGTHVDISEQSKHQDRIEKLNQELDSRVKVRTRELEQAKVDAQKLQHKAESANHAKSTFLANMSHELRTPLNSIIGFTNRLVRKLDGQIDSKNLDALRIVEENGKQLLSLINDLLDTAKIETGQLSLNRERFNCILLAQQCVDQAKPLSDEKNLELLTDFCCDELLIDADKKRVVQILLNMLSNAIKFTDKGSVTLAIEPMRKGDIAGVGFHVIDTGIGIAPELQAALFEKFTRADSAEYNAVKGTGLGLTLIKQLASLHQGSVEVISKEGEGSRFTAWLPTTNY